MLSNDINDSSFEYKYEPIGLPTDTHYVKRSCDTTTRNVNNSTWIDLDAIEVIRHWQKPIRQGAGGGASNRPVNHGLLLLIDVHDQNNQALNATQYFEPMDCQACECAVFRFLVLRSNCMAGERPTDHF